MLSWPGVNRVRAKLRGLLFHHLGEPGLTCPHADNDRIAAIRTNRSFRRGNYINHMAAAALVRNVRSTE